MIATTAPTAQIPASRGHMVGHANQQSEERPSLRRQARPRAGRSPQTRAGGTSHAGQAREDCLIARDPEEGNTLPDLRIPLGADGIART